MSTQRNSRNLFVHRGYLVGGPTVDGAFRSPRSFRDQEQDPDSDDVVEIHNHIPYSGGDEEGRGGFPANEERVVARYDPESFQEDEEPEEQNGEVARFPANGFTCRTEGEEIVVYRTRRSDSPRPKSDRHEMDTARDSRSRPPRTLSELNRLHAAHYQQKAGRR
jgi:hypothetical protein